MVSGLGPRGPLLCAREGRFPSEVDTCRRARDLAADLLRGGSRTSTARGISDDPGAQARRRDPLGGGGLPRSPARGRVGTGAGASGSQPILLPGARARGQVLVRAAVPHRQLGRAQDPAPRHGHHSKPDLLHRRAGQPGGRRDPRLPRERQLGSRRHHGHGQARGPEGLAVPRIVRSALRHEPHGRGHRQRLQRGADVLPAHLLAGERGLAAAPLRRPPRAPRRAHCRRG